VGQPGVANPGCASDLSCADKFGCAGQRGDAALGTDARGPRTAAARSFQRPQRHLQQLKHDPEKVGTGFPERSCSNKKLERDDDSKKSHLALALRGPYPATVAPLTKRQSNQSLMVNALLSVVVYFV
jgi:hypothetical protein